MKITGLPHPEWIQAHIFHFQVKYPNHLNMNQGEGEFLPLVLLKLSHCTRSQESKIHGPEGVLHLYEEGLSLGGDSSVLFLVFNQYPSNVKLINSPENQECAFLTELYHLTLPC